MFARRMMRAAWGSLPALAVSLVACTDGKQSPRSAEAPEAAVVRDYDLDIPMVEYRWDPQAGDPSVSAELGGPGFTGEGWDTNMKFLALGDPRAVKGGTMTRYIPDWPATLRQTGKDWNTSINYFVKETTFETLLKVHDTTLEFIPNVATHWKISDDKQTYRFRLNPEARFTDGAEITANDVVASWKLRMDPTLLSPTEVKTFGKLHEPVAVSKYILEVKVKEESWKNFLYFASWFTIFPAHEVSISGSEYLDKYQFSYTASSGPYIVRPEDIVRGQSITLRRRDDWWSRDNPAWRGVWNFDAIKYVVVKDPNLAFEKLKKGELDYFFVAKSAWWVEDLPQADPVKRGLVQMRKFFNDAPTAIQGIAVNMNRPPLDDLRIRKALCYLYDRETFIKKLFYDEYKPSKSYYTGGIYENPDNQVVPYDELKAVELLEEAGWKALNAEGYREKDGRELKFVLTYRGGILERVLTPFQEACKRAGIRIELERVTPAAGTKKMFGKEFELMHTRWGTMVFPNPETFYLSEFADIPNNNNVTAFKNPRVDELCRAYDAEYDIEKRQEILREIDGIAFNLHPYVLDWYLPAQRVAFANKFGMPEWGGWRTVDYDMLVYTWWVDPEKEKQLEAAREDPSIKLLVGDTENHFWAAWNAARKEKTRTAMRATDS